MGYVFGTSLGAGSGSSFSDEMAAGVGKEVYPNAPLAWVTAEVRYPQSPLLRRQETLDQIQLGLVDLLPVAREEHQLTVQFGPQTPLSQERERAYRLLNREATCSAVVGPQAVTVETTAYTRSEEFLDLVGAVVNVVIRHVTLAGIERVGLRYINEVRVPEPIADLRDWSGWITSGLVAAAQTGGDASARVMQGLVQYQIGEHQQAAFRYGALPEGTVIGAPAMRRGEVDTQRPVFILDFDSFWEAASSAEAMNPDGELVRMLLDDLHQPISEMFEMALTDRLRRLFRGE